MPRNTRFWMLCLALASIASSAAQQVLYRGAYGEPESLQPNQSGVSSEQTLLRDLFEGLTTWSPDGRLVPGAAESWRASADGREWTFTLRPGLKWSDGSALGADDWVFGLRRLLTPSTAAARATKLYILKNARAIHRGELPPDQLGVSADNARSLRLQLERPLPWLPALLADQEGTPLPRKVIERHGNQWTRPSVMVSNGAFRLEDRKPRGNIRLAKNPHYHDASRVKLTAVVYVPGDDTLSLVNRFRAGEIQVNGWPGFAPRQQLSLQRELGAAARVHPLISVRYLRFNVRRKPFDDPRIRAALSLAVDRERLIAKVLLGGEQPSVRAVPQGLPDDRWAGVNALSANNYATRLGRARALLAAAGWSKASARTIELRVPSGNGEDLCTAVAAMWTAAGVPTRVVRSEIKSLIADLRRGDFDIALTGAQDTPSVEAYLERFRAGSTYNTGGYSNSAFERAFDAAQLIAQPEQRGPAIAAVEAQLNQDHAIVPLLQEVARNLVAPQVRGWVDNANDVHLSRYLYLQQK